MAIIDGHIKCNVCGTLKPLAEFAPSIVKQKSGTCRVCRRAYSAGRPEKNKEESRKFYARNPGYSRASKLSKWYGLTVEQFDSMLAAQGGGCACCGLKHHANGKPLFVDHDHETGAIRGILCHGCNAGIGALGDTIEGVRRALSYLERAHQEKSPLRANVTAIKRASRG